MPNKATPQELIDWLNEELNKRNLSGAQASRRAGLNVGAISEIVNGRTPGLAVSTALAEFFGASPEKVLRLAGLLPSLPKPVAEEREAVRLLRQMEPNGRAWLMVMLRGLAGQKDVMRPAVIDAGIPYDIPSPDDELTSEMLAEFEKLSDGWKEIAIAQVAQLYHRTRPKGE